MIEFKYNKSLDDCKNNLSVIRMFPEKYFFAFMST